MDPKDETKRVLKVLDEARKDRGWGEAGKLDRKLGNTPGYVARLLSGKPAMRLGQLFEILNVLKFDPGEFFAWVFGARYHFQPERYLRELERKKEKTQLLKRIDRIIVVSALPKEQTNEGELAEASLDELSADLSRIEELKFTDSLVANTDSIDLLRAIVKRVEQDSDFLPIFGEALSLAGDTEMALRNHSSGAAYLIRALEVSKKHRYLKSEAMTLQRCCYLIATQGDYDIARAFAQQALHSYALLGDAPGIGKCLVDQGIMLRRAGHAEQSIEYYEAALKYLPRGMWQYRVALYQSLGFAYIHCGDVDKADRCAKAAGEEHQTKEGINWWKIFWLHGEVALCRNNLDYAERVFREVRSALEAHGNNVNVALVCLRLSLTLLMAGRVGEMLELASEMLLLIDRIKSENKMAAEIMNDFIKMALVGKVTESFLDHAYQKLLEAVESAQQCQ